MTPSNAPPGASRGGAGTLVVRPFRLGDVDPLCALLGDAFAAEYAEQGLSIKGFRRQYQLVGLANAVLAPLHLDFFKVAVAIWTPFTSAGPSAPAESTISAPSTPPATPGLPRLVGTLTSFPVDNDGVWYHGFGAVDPTLRRQGVFKRVIRFALEDIARRGAKLVGGEIRTTNEGSLRTYRDNFGAEILPEKGLWLLPPGRLQEMPASDETGLQAVDGPGVAPDGSALSLARLGERGFRKLPQAAAITPGFRGGFVIEREVRRSLPGSILRGLVPPITVVTWASFDRQGRLAALARVRTHWPAGIEAIDTVWLAPGLTTSGALGFLSAVARRHGATARPSATAPDGSSVAAEGTRPSLRLYAGAHDDRLQSLAARLGFRLWCHVYPFRAGVQEALAGTDATGSRRPAP